MSDLTQAETELKRKLSTLSEYSHNLLDSIDSANRASGLDEKQDARWEVTKHSEVLSKFLDEIDGL